MELYAYEFCTHIELGYTIRIATIGALEVTGGFMPEHKKFCVLYIDGNDYSVNPLAIVSVTWNERIIIRRGLD